MLDKHIYNINKRKKQQKKETNTKTKETNSSLIVTGAKSASGGKHVHSSCYKQSLHSFKFEEPEKN
jgi:hypothetical protein